MGFPERLREQREKKQLTQTQLGKLFNLSKQAISSYEKGGSRPGQETLIKFADFFGVPVGYLLGAENNIIREPSPKYSATVSAYTEAMNILDEIEKEIKSYHEKGIPIDRASVQKIVEHRRRVLRGEDAWIKYILDANGIGEAMERIAELDSGLNFDDKTMLQYIRKAKEKFGLPTPVETDPAAHGPKIPGTGVFDNEGSDKPK